MALRDRFFPPEPVCLSCQGKIIFSILSNICDDCLQEMSFVTRSCLRCGSQLPEAQITGFCQICRSQELKLESIRAPLIYRERAREILLELKYHKNSSMALPLGQLMADYWKFFSDDTSRDYLVIPVPLSRERLTARGFNQARLLGEVVAREAGLMTEDVLIRKRNTPPLYHLNNQQRNLVLRGAFKLPADRAGRVTGRKILLVDDIVTTGSTLNEAATILLAAGACRVSALTAATAERV